jgi:hypothetical protein
MSALPPKADIAERDCHVRFVPISTKVQRRKMSANCDLHASQHQRFQLNEINGRASFLVCPASTHIGNEV